MLYKEAVKKAPCTERCPAGIDIPRYTRLISLGKFQEALAVIRQRIPFPSVCGHVCLAPCETACREHHITEPVAINALKRFVTEQVSTPHPSPPTKSTGKKVAVVGSGPAGLTAAYYLAKLGHRVTVLEALPVAGGMMRVGIPEYRLPRKILDKEIEEIKGVGVEIKTSTRVESLQKLLAEGYDSVLLAGGAHRAQKLPLLGADLPNVLLATSFLREVNLGRKVKLGNKVVVLGGGDVAFDCGRTALRLGASEAHLACLEPRDCLVASQGEIQQGLEEGIIIHPSRTFAKIVSKDGHITGVECCNVRSFKFDREGKVAINAIEGSQHVLLADTIIFAIGQSPDLELVKDIDGIKVTRRGTVQVNPATLSTGKKGVFAAGDMVTGSASVIEAIAAGRRAAISIDKYLGGKGKIDEVLAPPTEELPPLLRGIPVGKRTVMPTLPVKERLSGFAEAELGFDKAAVLHESTRCLWCDLPIYADVKKCVGCNRCALLCSFRFEGAFNPSYGKIKVVSPNRSSNIGDSDISFADDCDGCGICIRTCSYGTLTRGDRAEIG